MNRKTLTIIYYSATIPLSLFMLGTGYGQIVQNNPDFVAEMNKLGYPLSFLVLLGISKILGIIAIWVPNFHLVKEWAYAGFVFTLIGATYAQAMAGVIPGFQLAILIIILISLFTYRKLKVDTQP